MIDSREANRNYYNFLLESFSCPLMTEEELNMVHMLKASDSTRYIFRKHTHVDMEEVVRFRQEIDYSRFLQYIRVEPDLHEFLRLIKSKYHTAISTNRTTIDIIMDTYELTPWFDMVVTANDVKKSKPAPDALFKILDTFKVSRKEALYIGDSEVDQKHCQAVGVDMIAYKSPALEAKYHVSSFMEILQLPPFTRPSR
ncbi:MAG: beta-phosphoglucomutase [Desulfobulbus propionicus]|nr:MAG: beta-phosphoglucomutase [Desulfobulbus propionicus]